MFVKWSDSLNTGHWIDKPRNQDNKASWSQRKLQYDMCNFNLLEHSTIIIFYYTSYCTFVQWRTAFHTGKSMAQSQFGLAVQNSHQLRNIEAALTSFAE